MAAKTQTQILELTVKNFHGTKWLVGGTAGQSSLWVLLMIGFTWHSWQSSSSPSVMCAAGL